MRNFLIFIAITVFLVSCQQKEEHQTVTVESDTLVTGKDTIKETNQKVGDTIHLNFKDEKGHFTAETSVDSLHPKIYLTFINDRPGELKASIKTPTGGGNIRFNQIIFPDKTMDGPFAIDMEFPLKQTGEHTLIIGHSQMADNPYWGNFSIDLHVE